MSMKRLNEAMKQKNSVIVVGIDPKLDRIPPSITEAYEGLSEILFAFSREIIDHVKDLVPAVKFQIAYFESYGLEGIKAFAQSIAYAKAAGLYCIGDVKRGDIGTTARAYAEAFLKPGSDFEVDTITINPYLGDDSNNEFFSLAKAYDKGTFLLIKTSNPSSGQLQNQLVDQAPVYELLAKQLSENPYYDGQGQVAAAGIVVGATYPEELAKLRSLLPTCTFLIPGYGAQGGKGEDLKKAFNEEGLGAIVNSSRGIIYAFEKEGGRPGPAARKAVMAMNQDLNQWRL